VIAAGTPFYVTGGNLPWDAPSYVERQADRELYEGLIRGDYCYVLHARQMGKSSLMVHATSRLRQEGIAVTAFELTALGQNLTVEQWYDGLLSRIGRELDLEDELEAYWLAHERLSPLQRWLGALQEVVLIRVPGRIVIFLDEIDAVRSLPFSTDEFFAAIRQCYNRRAQDRAFERLTFCLLGVATPSDLIQDTRTTPFNIGRRIELTDFSAAEAAPLAQGLGRAKTSQVLLQRVLHWTGGHPYLTQRLCQAIATNGAPNPQSAVPGATPRGHPAPQSVDRLCEALFLSASAREKDDNLLFVRERLLRGEADRASLLDLYGQVRAGKRVSADDTNPLIDLLRLSGITRLHDGHLRLRNRIYERVFDPGWVARHMPDAELRRQRAAYRRGVLRATAIATGVLAVMAGLALMAVSQARLVDRNARQEARQRRVADEQRRLAQEGQRTLRRHLYGAQLNLAQQAAEAGDLERAGDLLAGQRPPPGEEDPRGFEWRYLRQLCEGDTPRRTFRGHRGWVNSLAFSPDFRLLATGGFDSSIRLWEVRSGHLLATLWRHRLGVVAVAFSPNGRLLASASSDKTVRLWDVGTRGDRPREAATLAAHESAVAVLFSPDGRYLVSSGYGGAIRLWDVASRRMLGVFGTDLGAKDGLAFAPDGKTLVTGSPNGPLYLWEVPSRRQIATLRGHFRWINALAISPDGRMVASGSDDNTLRLWDRIQRREVAILRGHSGLVGPLAFSPDGRRLASTGNEGTILVWDLATRRIIATRRAHRRWVGGIAFSPDGKRLFSAGSGGIKEWDLTARSDTGLLVRQKAPVHTLAFAPDGRALAVGDNDGMVRLWDLRSRRVLATLPRQGARIREVTFSPDGKLLAAVSDQKTAKIWAVGQRAPTTGSLKPPARSRHSRARPATWREVATLRHVPPYPHILAFSPDRRVLAVGNEGKGVKLRRLTSPGGRLAEIGTLPNMFEIWGLAFSPDGRTLMAGNGGVMQRWDVASRRAAAFHQAVEWAGPLQWSPDGRLLATQSNEGGVKLWDLATNRTLATVHGTSSPGETLLAVAFSPEGKTLAMTDRKHILLWNRPTQQAAVTLKGHTGLVSAVAFSPDGRTLASGDSDGTVRLWHAGPEAAADWLPALPIWEVSSRCSDREVQLLWHPQSAALAYNLYRGPAGALRPELRKLTDQPVAGRPTESGGLASFTDRSPALVNGRPMTYAVAPLYRGEGGRLTEALPQLFPAIPLAPPPGFQGCSIYEGGLHSGSARFDAATGLITLRGSGHDLWETSDGCYFLCRPLTGDFQISVKMLSRPTRTTFWTHAGLMVRETLATGSRHASLVVVATPSWPLEAKIRPYTDDSTESQRLFLHTMPITLRLIREGNTIQAACARDESDHFEPAGVPMRFPTPLAPTVYAGLVITTEPDSVSEARFSGLEVRGR
jgi:WD40 repeat protein